MQAHPDELKLNGCHGTWMAEYEVALADGTIVTGWARNGNEAVANAEAIMSYIRAMPEGDA